MEENKFKVVFENGKPKLDKDICLGIVCTEQEPENKDERYHFHLALEYFKNNFLLFNEKEITTVCSNPYALKRLGGNFDITALQVCVKNEQAFPVALPSWAGKKIKRDLLKKYLRLINEKNDVEQLNFFLEHFYDGVMEFIDENTNISKTLYEGISKHLLSKKPHQNLTAIKDILVKRDVSIFQYLEENYKDDFKKILSAKIGEEYKNKVTLNVAQYLLLNKEFESLSIISEIFSTHKDLLLEPINNKICLYNQKVSIFEYGLTHSKLIAFAPFSLDDNLNNEQTEQLVSAAFSLLQHRHEALDNGAHHLNHIPRFEEVLKHWYRPIIEQSNENHFQYYCKEVMKGNKNNSELKKEVETLILHRDLNNNLATNDTLTKRLKL